MLRSVVKIALIVLLGLVIIGIGLDRLLDANDFRDCLSKVDNQNDQLVSKSCPSAKAIVVISGGDTKARTAHAANLFKAGLAPILITSGASAQANVVSNAEEMRQIAIDEFKVPAGAILVDTQARNTHQNAKYVKQLIAKYNQEHQQKQIDSIILVTSGYHQNRAYREFRTQLNPEMRIYNAPVARDKDWSKTWYLSLRGWFLAIQEAIGSLLVSKE